MNPAIANLTTLVLNANHQPLSWAPLSVWPWEDAITAVLGNRVVQLCAYDEIRIRTATETFAVPSVVALKRFRRRKAVPFTRYNVFLRDEFKCQYCGTTFDPKDLTYDHIKPKQSGGLTSWLNISAACAVDNQRKGGKSLAESKMKLIRPPYIPTPEQIDAAARKFAPKNYNLHKTWIDYLYWDSELQT